MMSGVAILVARFFPTGYDAAARAARIAFVPAPVFRASPLLTAPAAFSTICR
jgi:hypothetical protein